MNIGTVEITGTFKIVNHQQRNYRELELKIYLEDSETVEALREQGRYTHLVHVYEPFQSEKKYYDCSDDSRNILQIELQCGTLTIKGFYIQFQVEVEETSGADPGYFLTYQLIKLEG